MRAASVTAKVKKKLKQIVFSYPTARQVVFHMHHNIPVGVT